MHGDLRKLIPVYDMLIDSKLTNPNLNENGIKRLQINNLIISCQPIEQITSSQQ